MSDSPYETHGTTVRPRELERFVGHLLDVNAAAEAEGRPRTPICVWGLHGIGKTQILRDLAARRGARFASFAPAQFEEMGDLVGMPAIEGERTVFRPPAWVPSEPGPGVLLIDDVNRADDRILRGIMQLLQDHRLVSWALPEGWSIVLTANPDGGDYTVTPMDDAMLTRMMHVTLAFDVKDWARWALGAGVDPRGVDFVLTHPEVAHGRRTTPRTLVQFFESLRALPDLREELGLVGFLAHSCLDAATAGAFLGFVAQGLGALVGPEELMALPDVAAVEARLRHDLGEGEALRLDALATVCTRLVLWATASPRRPEEVVRLGELLKLPLVPADLRLAMARDLVHAGDPALAGLMAEPEVARLVLGGL